jgi:catalase
MLINELLIEKERTMTDKKKLTTNGGCPVVNNQNVMTVDGAADAKCDIRGFVLRSSTKEVNWDN